MLILTFKLPNAMNKFITLCLLASFICNTNTSNAQLYTKVFAGYEGGVINLPSTLKRNYETTLDPNYSSYKFGLGVNKVIFSSVKKRLSLVSDVYFKSYNTSKMRFNTHFEQTFKINANYIGISTGVEYNISGFAIQIQPFAAYMVHNKETLITDDGKKEELYLSNTGAYAINYLNYGCIVSLALISKAEKPKFGVRANYPISINKFYDDGLDAKFTNNRWFSFGEIQLEYYF